MLMQLRSNREKLRIIGSFFGCEVEYQVEKVFMMVLQINAVASAFESQICYDNERSRVSFVVSNDVAVIGKTIPPGNSIFCRS